MSVHHDILAELGLHKGAQPMTTGQFRKRIEAYQRQQWQPLLREKDPAGYEAWRVAMLPTVAEAEANFAFNHQLAAYRQAAARLARFRLAEGRAESVTRRATGARDATGAPVYDVAVRPAIAPLPPSVAQPAYGKDGAVIGVQQVPNPAIEADEAERDTAQAVIDAASEVVRAFDSPPV